MTRTTLDSEAVSQALSRLALGSPRSHAPQTREPVHVLYGGAHLFSSDLVQKVGLLASRSFKTYAPDEQTFAEVFELRSETASVLYERVARKLEREPVEDYRIDLEDGYGHRPDDEEDHHAVRAAKQLAAATQAGSLPPFCGFRVKALSSETAERSIRTLDLFVTTLVNATSGNLPDNFVVTLPKAETAGEVAALVSLLSTLERKLGLERGLLGFELMVETPAALVGRDGRFALQRLITAADGRCVAAHFGAYDYTASLGISSSDQDLRHPACDLARQIMQLSLAHAGVRLVDGATNVLPVAPHRAADLTADQFAENRAVVHRAWKIHYDNIRYSLSQGFYQSWDLHPAQLVARYAAVYAFFHDGKEAAAKRLTNFIDTAARATLSGDVFDDAATGQGLLNFFIRAVNCGAMSEEEARHSSSLSAEELRSGSFLQILKRRRVLNTSD